ncbi:MAG: BBP7 family outer membrane beta-barrel protein, partial [Planctomycetaceae bacterium]|nr:BBP7 family outer membrane beta-barrel protein [Planctomycetaceae bacterium]
NEFVYVPEIMMTVAYDWRENIQLSAGYTFTYWSRVLLAGDQIDRNINTSQLGGGTLTGSSSPAFTFRDTDFWLQGLRLGFNWTY